MLQYLVILLDDTSVAYCHADNPLTERNLIPLDTLKKAILFGMKENLMIQYVLPDYELPKEYQEVMESIDNVKIRGTHSSPSAGIIVNGTTAPQATDVIVYNDIPTAAETAAYPAQNIVIRLPFKEMMAKRYDIVALMIAATKAHAPLPPSNLEGEFRAGRRINLVITDVEKFTDEQIEEYKKALNEWALVVKNSYSSQEGKDGGVRHGNASLLQVNLLTDRLQLDKMHNCEAGVSNITLAPNGKFYLCPAFYYDEKMGVNNRLNHHKPASNQSVGDLETGVQIPNQQLLKLDHAPLCRICDAYQCRRCVWLNQRLTWDANTPSHQQCVLAHLERNASRDLQIALLGTRSSSPATNEIKEINYLDPFDVREEF